MLFRSSRGTQGPAQLATAKIRMEAAVCQNRSKSASPQCNLLPSTDAMTEFSRHTTMHDSFVNMHDYDVHMTYTTDLFVKLTIHAIHFLTTV